MPINVNQVNNALKVNYGKRTVFIVAGGIPVDELPAVATPNLLVKEQGQSQFLPKPPRRNLKNGVAGTPQIYGINIVNNAGLSGTSTLVITGAISGNNKTYTFTTGTPTSSQIQIGLTDTATEENIRAAIQADLAFFGFSSVAVVSGVVRITGPLAGAAFATPSSNENSTVIAFTNIQANIPAILSFLNFEFATIANSEPIEGQVISLIAGVSINGLPDDLMFDYSVQAGQTIATALTAMATELRKLFAVSVGAPVLLNSRAGLRENSNYTLADIKAAASAFYQDVTASGNILAITAVANTSLTKARASSVGINILPPDFKILIDENGVPIISGIEGFGVSTDSFLYALTSNGTSLFVQEREKKYLDFSTELEELLTLNQLQRDPRVMYLTNSSTDMASGVDTVTMLPGNINNENYYGLIAVQPSRHIPGAYDVIVAPLGISRDITIGLQKAAENFPTINFKPISRPNETSTVRIQIAVPTKIAV